MLRSLAVSGVLLVTCMTAGAQARETYFRTPSKNIYCLYMELDDEPTVRCDILEARTSYRKPADCEFDFGQSFSITETGKHGLALCYSDSVMTPDAGEIGYGESFEEGGISCAVERSGVTCTNRRGHGFFMSKAKQKVF